MAPSTTPMQQQMHTPQQTQAQMLIVNEASDPRRVGTHTGQCKWFSDKLGYGFITVQGSEHAGKDIFVHHTGIRPLNSIYRTLRKGEYVNLDIVLGEHGPQALNVTGIGGGCLMCDVVPSPRLDGPPPHGASVTHSHANCYMGVSASTGSLRPFKRIFMQTAAALQQA